MRNSLFRSCRVLASAVLLASCAKPSQKTSLVIFHTNAISGRIAARGGDSDGEKKAGGFAALAKAVAGETAPKLLVDTGNWFEGTPEGMESHGKAVVELMNAVGFDASTLGSHDFMYGEKNLKSLVEAAKFPVLAANLYDAKSGQRSSLVKPWIVKEVGGVKVGLFGLASRRVPLETEPQDVAGLKFRRELDEAQDAIKELRKQGAQLVVALSHAGMEPEGQQPFEGDKFLASHADGLDLIIGGKCAEGQPAWRDAEKGTLVACTPGQLKDVGRLSLELDASGKLVRADDELISLDVEKLGQDENISKLVSKWQDETAKEMDEKIASAERELLRNRFAESTLGNWMTDCMRTATKTQAAFLNSGAIRADVGEGKVTKRSIFEAMPFEDGLFTEVVSGRQIKAALERGFSGDRGVLQISGLSVVFDPTALPGLRVAQVTLNGKPLSDSGTYKIAVSKFLVDGGDGFLEFGEGADLKGTDKLLRDTLDACARDERELAPPPLGRVKVSSL